MLSRWGGTPLDDAIRHGHIDVAQPLESRGAGPGKAARDERQVDGCVSGLTASTGDENREAVEMIYAAAEGDLHAIQRLAARGVSIASTGYDWRTSLHLAAAEGYEPLVS